MIGFILLFSHLDCINFWYFPYGVNGMLAGSATVFFAYIGFDSVASTAEEVKNPQRDLPIGIGTALSMCFLLYMMVSIVIVGLVPYFAMDPDTPISSAFAKNDMQLAMYIVTAGAVLALCSTLLGSLLPQPRILMAMARDGLLPPFFSDVNTRTQVPVKGTILTGVFAASLAFFMDVSELSGMVSVGTLFAFTTVAISILILRYVPPTESQEDSKSQENDVEASTCFPLIAKETEGILNEQARRRKAAFGIACECIGVVIVTTSASYSFLPLYVRYAAYIDCGLLLLGCLVLLSWIDQDDRRHSFGHSGGFICPFVPLLPTCCILINAYLLVNLGAGTWMRVSIWLLIGLFVYVFYGRNHSSLIDVIYVPVAHTDEIYQKQSSGSVA